MGNNILDAETDNIMMMINKLSRCRYTNTGFILVSISDRSLIFTREFIHCIANTTTLGQGQDTWNIAVEEHV